MPSYRQHKGALGEGLEGVAVAEVAGLGALGGVEVVDGYGTSTGGQGEDVWSVRREM